jgi:hypothetical protein
MVGHFLHLILHFWHPHPCGNLLIAQICSEHHGVCGVMVDYARMRCMSCISFVTLIAALFLCFVTLLGGCLTLIFVTLIAAVILSARRSAKPGGCSCAHKLPFSSAVRDIIGTPHLPCAHARAEKLRPCSEGSGRFRRLYRLIVDRTACICIMLSI